MSEKLIENRSRVALWKVNERREKKYFKYFLESEITHWLTHTRQSCFISELLIISRAAESQQSRRKKWERNFTLTKATEIASFSYLYHPSAITVTAMSEVAFEEAKFVLRKSNEKALDNGRKFRSIYWLWLVWLVSENSITLFFRYKPRLYKGVKQGTFLTEWQKTEICFWFLSA